MATLQELLNQASEIRDAELEGENTAVRVGTMLINIIEHIGQFVTSTQLEQTLRDVSNGMEEWLEKYAQIDSNSGLLDFNHSWFVPLATMGPAYDESTEEYTPASGEIYYKEQSGYRIFVRTSSSGNIGYPAKVGVVYLNKRTGKWYKWNGDSMVKLPGGGDSGEVVNDLVTGGADIPLSAEMGKRLKTKIDEVQANIQRLYNNLGNIAFWDAAAKAAAAPVAIDWGNPKHTVTLDLDLTNAVAKHDGVTKSDGDTILVEEGSTLNIIVEPDSGYMLTDNNISSSTAGVDVTPLGNGAYSVAIVMRQSNLTLSISAEAAEVLLLNATMNLKGFTAESEPTPTYRQQYQVVLNLDKYYFPLGTYPDVYYPSPYDSILREQVSVMVGNTDITNNPGVKSVRADGKELTITIPAEGVTDDIIITARAQCYVYYGKGMDNNNQISYSNGALILP